MQLSEISFEVFVGRAEPRLRHALVAAVGWDRGRGRPDLTQGGLSRFHRPRRLMNESPAGARSRGPGDQHRLRACSARSLTADRRRSLAPDGSADGADVLAKTGRRSDPMIPRVLVVLAS